MNFCPECGGIAECTDSEADVATTHFNYTCLRNGCGMKWVETRENSYEAEVLHISPVKEE